MLHLYAPTTAALQTNKPVAHQAAKCPFSHYPKAKRATQANFLFQAQLQLEKYRGRIKRQEQIYECRIRYQN